MGGRRKGTRRARERFRSDICRRRRRARARELKVLAPRGMARCARRNTGPLRNLRARAMPTRDDKSGRSGAARCARQKTVRPRNLRASAKRGRAENFAPAGEAHYPCRQAPRRSAPCPRRTRRFPLSDPTGTSRSSSFAPASPRCGLKSHASAPPAPMSDRLGGDGRRSSYRNPLLPVDQKLNFRGGNRGLK